MKGIRLLIVAAIAVLATPTASLAEHPNIRDHMYHAPKQVQLLNEDPLFTDHRTRPSVSQQYIIEAPTQKQPAPPPLMIRPSANPSVMVDVSQLPPAGFESNMHAQRPVNLMLPDATSTNRLIGKMLAGSKAGSAPMAAHALPAKRLAALPATTGPVALVYSSQPPVSSAGSMSVKTNVSGLLQQRGSLIQRH